MDSLTLTDDISYENFDENKEFILKNVKLKQNEVLEPSYKEKMEIFDIVMNYIKINKRKIYGGYALNKLFVNKDKQYGFYDDILDDPDIDFYSPEPIKDVVNISNMLFEKGFNPIFSKEAQHKDTFKIFPNLDKECCDITYVPNNIYNNIRYIEIDGIRYIHPWFAMIDKFRVFTDPLTSYRILEKDLKRFKVLDKLYPLPFIKQKLEIDKYKNNDINNLLKNIFVKYLIHQKNFIFSGLYCYDYYLYDSKIFESKNNSYEYINIPYYEIYTTNYINDAENLVEYIEKFENLEYSEYYPLFQYYGYSTVIFYKINNKKIPIIYLYDNNKRCIPVKKMNAIFFSKNEMTSYKEKIYLASFDFNILHTLINLLKVRVDGENDMNDRLYKYLNGIIQFRKYFFENNDKNIIKDDTLFQSFFPDCKGKTIQSDREKRIRDSLNREQKKLVEWRYDPKCPDKIQKYYHSNFSGKEIHKDKDKQLFSSHTKMNDENKFKKFIQNDNTKNE